MMKQRRLKVAIVEYYNTAPFLNGLERYPEYFDLHPAIPSKCADLFDAGEVDIALIPIASYFEMTNAKIVSEYGIACDGEVRTVVLFANEPIEQIDKIYLDNHSRTSVQLLKVLMRDHWKKHVEYEKQEVTDVQLKKGEAVLMIGDKVFRNEKKFRFTYDLGHEWKSHTQLPFVFAVWIAKKNMVNNDIKLLNVHLQKGLASIPHEMQNWNKKYNLDLDAYLTKHIKFKLSEDYQKAMMLFRNKMSGVNLTV